jgi:phosphoribosylformimino-5-aminoimidazole carboxamide ribotide isomerase
MEIFPAIDLQNGQCVRLAQGNFEAVTIYEDDPLLVARRFMEAGVSWVHVVDLDGAREGQVRQSAIIKNMAQKVPLSIQAGGGIRDERDIEALLDAGVKRIVIGSLAVKETTLVKSWLQKYGSDRIVLAFDVRLDEANEPEIVINGWKSGSLQSLWGILKIYEDSGLKTVVCTDVGRDGMMTGSNLELYKALRERRPDLDVLASGGVKGIADLLTLNGLGLTGAITGKAIYEGRLDLAAAVRTLKGAPVAG